ncbi:MAG: hypothetical protein K5910_03350 [Bacteroidales bacterium]|nr:hypothetical protein [Bacteroidales bacterium]
MSKTRSPLSRGLRVLYVLPLVCLGLGLQARTIYVPVDKDNEKIVSGERQDEPASKTEFILNLTADGKIDTGEKELSIPEAGALIEVMTAFAPEMIVRVVAPPDVRMEVLDELKDELRKAKVLKVMYSMSPEEAAVTRDLPVAGQDRDAQVSKFPPEMLSGVNRDDICVALLNANDRIFFLDGAVQEDAEILRKGTAFLRERGAGAHFILRADQGTSYGAYLHLQSLLRQIYDTVREEKAQALFGKTLDGLTQAESDEITRLLPIAITEATKK